MEEINAIVNIIVNNGMAVGITAYFLYRDWKFNQQLQETLGSIKSLVSEMKGVIDTENK